MYDKNENDKINQKSKYSVYNYLYHYLLDNYEPEHLKDESARRNAEGLLMKEGIAYARKGQGDNSYETIRVAANQAIDNFIKNNGSHGDTANNFGKAQDNSFKTIKNTIQELRW